ncbi:STAS domain-containing protein [Geomonas sp. Red32]|uniref:STAS domain-containing protein n=1 Tax=Geomonas sp. Red32 TaxID=2912856 RepID=UPI00202CE9B8|nr:STAS domain-containing protein [Geomonas sp. Red32]MCM0081350.1 STAS domain-containing protein [Geomonas sp. Red32]
MDELTLKRIKHPKKDGIEELKVSGGLNIAEAARFREALIDALAAAPKTLQLNLNEVTEMDLTGLQLLCSAHHSALSAGKSFKIVDQNEVYIRVASEAGFERHVGCPRDNNSSCIWVGGAH